MEFAFEELIRNAFAEDCAYEDITTLSCVDESLQARARFLSKQPGIVAGLKYIPRIFSLYDSRIQAQVLIPEGKKCEPGEFLAEIQGPARSLLSAERVALNFLQHLCGIATLTSLCVAEVQGFPCQILDTRKTIPGLRSLQKYAVRMGGGTNHRFHLADRILIKNNHLFLSAKDLFSCVRKTRSLHPSRWIEVEIDHIDQLIPTLEAGADALILDNMTPEQVRECVLLNKKKAYLEASGGISLKNLRSYAAAGVDGISMGALTHSAPALDLSLRIF